MLLMDGTFMMNILLLNSGLFWSVMVTVFGGLLLALVPRPFWQTTRAKILYMVILTVWIVALLLAISMVVRYGMGHGASVT